MAAIDELRRAEGIGVSEAVNRLVREGLAKARPAAPYRHRSVQLGLKVDVANVGDVLDLLDSE